MAGLPIVASNLTVRGARNAKSIALTLSATDPNPGEVVKSFTIDALPLDGVLYLDAAETIPFVAGVNYAATNGALDLFFAPTPDFAGTVNFNYTATGGGGGVVNGTPATTFYLTIDGLNGGSTALGHKGAFEISTYSFNVTELINAVTGAAGAPTFDPLSVALPALNSQLTTLLADLATAHTIARVRLEGVSALDGPDVFDLRLNNVSVARDAFGGSLEQLAFAYGAVSLTTTALTPTGAAGVSNTVGYDLTRNTPLTDPLAPANAGTNAAFGSFTGATQTFLTVDGVNGGSTQKNHAGDFALQSFGFLAIGAPANLGGGGAGKPNFQPLHVVLSQGSGAARLESLFEQGAHTSLRLQEVATGVNGETVLVDLRLGDVSITSFNDGAKAGADALDQLTFSYNQISMTTTPLSNNGAVGSPQFFGFDIAKNAPIATSLPIAKAGGAVDGGAATLYYLTVDGVDGGSTAKGHVGAFEIVSYSQGANAGPAPTGKPAFNDLNVNLTSGSEVAALLNFTATQGHIPFVRLEGVGSLGGPDTLDLRLGDAIVSAILQTGGDDQLSFNFTQVSQTTTAYDTTGAATGSTTAAYNLKTGVASNTPLPAAKAGTVVDGAPAANYFLTIDGIDGGSTVAGHEGAFEIGANFNTPTILNLGQAGKAIFTPAHFVVTLGPGATALLQAAVTGGKLGNARIVGAATNGATVYDLRLGNVTLVDDASTQDAANFQLTSAQISLTTTAQTPNGSLGASNTFGFDVSNNVPLLTPISAAVAGTTLDGSSPTTFYLTVAGVNGGSTAKGHEGAFEISSYKFDVSQGAKAGGGTQAIFGPLTVNLNFGSGLVDLLGDAAGGTHISAVRLEGVGANGGPDLYDLRLGDLVVTDVNNVGPLVNQIGPDGKQLIPILSSVSFAYSVGSLTTTTDPAVAAPATQTLDFNAIAPSATLGGSPLAPAQAGGAVDGAAPTLYYLTVDGVDGGSTAKGHVGEFEVSASQIDIQNTTSLLAGGGSGKAILGPLTISFGQGSGLTNLLQDISSGVRIAKVRLEGVQSLGGPTVYDLRLGNVNVSQLTDRSNTPAGPLPTDFATTDSLAFNYTQVSLTTTAVDPNGALSGAPVTTAYDQATGITSTTQLPAAQVGDDIVSAPATASIVVVPPPTVTERLFADTGLSPDDLLTSNPELTGTADPSGVIHFTVDNLALDDTVTADNSGFWTFTPVLSDGAHTVVASETNDVNLTGSASLSFTLDRLTSESAISDADVTTGSDGKAYINAAHFSGGFTALAGSAEPGDIVVVTDAGNAVVGTVSADVIGAWMLPVFGLVDGGAYAYTATATDAAGNTATSAPFAFTVDTTTSESAIADASVTTGSDGKAYINAVNFNGGATTLTGVAEAGDMVVVREVANQIVATVQADATTGAWSAPVSGLVNGGAYSYAATATDAAGNTAFSAPFAFTVDTATSESAIADAAVTTGSDGRAYINAANFNGGVTTLSGTAEAGDIVVVTDAANAVVGTIATDPATGAWTLAVSGLVNGGAYSYTATATDAAGNTATSAPFSFKVATSTSESPIADAAVTTGRDGKAYINGAHFNGGVTTLSGVAGAGDTVVVRNAALRIVGTVQADPTSGAWSLPITGLVDGRNYSFTATATDAVGNTASSAPFAFTVDIATRESAIADGAVRTGADGKAYINAARFNGGATTLTGVAEPGDAVVITDGVGQVVGTVAANARTGAWRLAVTGLVNGGAYSYTATATDAAGNFAASAPFTFTVDTTTSESAIADAAVTIGSDGRAYINAAHFNGGTTTLTGAAEAGDTVTVRNAANLIVGTAKADAATGAWSLAVAGLVNGRSYKFVATATDAAGNRAVSAPYSFRVNTTLPGVSISSAGGNVTNPRQTIAGTGAAGTVVTLFDGTSALGGPVTVDRFGHWSETVLLPNDGLNAITAQDTDAAGNVGVSGVDSLTLLAGPPAFSSGGGGSRATYHVNPGASFVAIVSATGDPGESVSYALLDAQGRPQAAVGNFAIDPVSGALTLASAPAGREYTANVIATDTATGLASQQAITVDVARSLFNSSGFAVMSGDRIAGVTDTFVFQPGFRIDLVDGYRASDATVRGHLYPRDMLAFDHTLFTGAVAGEPGSQFAAIMAAHSAGFGDATFISTDTGGEVVLAGVNRAALLANSATFAVF